VKLESQLVRIKK